MIAEEHLALIILIGLGLAAVAFAWLLIRAFRTSFLWGVGVLLLVGLPFFATYRRQRAAAPLMLLALGLLVAGTTITLNRLGVFVDLGPYEKHLLDGLHLTLTGWDRSDYSILSAKTEAVVVQMANADVTDDVVALLRSFTNLRELDVSNSAITDAALPVLAELPNLAVLRLRSTAITEDGFRQHLFDIDRFTDLDLRDTGVASKTAREWKSARDGRNILYGKTPPAP